ncbi:flagellin [Acidovorax sp. CCYZU-2555]|uniref:flagellin N-terminal helical domain-containing protein n=1 Tax=Acidovorax sp. CCYZU-2555 TaxID=2835042 RepID=UPI001BCAA5A3|nr:flagellin [Acidovorax sp. CCYZU-2555]MBS7781192.1 flagellin [Acidovorax sp. CCYZU-2555]
MAMTINTNVASINAQRNLSLSGSSLTTSMQRLSSGLRVNSAKDDAAGLAISERMKAQSGGLTVAARNANDGISLAQTAEGALGKVGDMLQRVRELAVQSSNATNSASDRTALQAEVTQLVSEIDRVAKTTSFNGTKILDGSFAGGVFQVGANAGDNITVSGIANAKVDALGGVKVGSVSTDSTTVTAFADAVIDNTDPLNPIVTTPATYGADVTGLTVNGIALDDLAAASSKDERLGQVVAAINGKTADTGVTAFLEKDSEGVLTVQLRAEGKIELVGFAEATTMLDAGDSVDQTAYDALPTSVGINTLSVKTQADAWEALKQVDESIDQVNSARADLGALQTRFEKSVENIDIQNENIKAASGRITDADFAVETANLSRSQILQQAGTAMVAQANQLPQSVLSLLR